MLRIIFINLFLLLLPTAIYLAYVYYIRRDGPPDAPLNEAPIFWLLGTGVLMVLATLLYFTEFSGGKPGGKYVPPAVKDGVIQPGHME